MRKEDHILLLLQKSTGHADGQYGLIAGHIEAGKSTRSVMAQETKVRARIQINALSEKTISYIQNAITLASQGIIYSEDGF